MKKLCPFSLGKLSAWWVILKRIEKYNTFLFHSFLNYLKLCKKLKKYFSSCSIILFLLIFIKSKMFFPPKCFIFLIKLFMKTSGKSLIPSVYKRMFDSEIPSQRAYSHCLFLCKLCLPNVFFFFFNLFTFCREHLSK